MGTGKNKKNIHIFSVIAPLIPDSTATPNNAPKIVQRERTKRTTETAGSYKEVCLTHGRGELCSPAGDRRSPLRINKFDTQKARDNLDRFLRSVGVSLFCSINWNLTACYSNSFFIPSNLFFVRTLYFKVYVAIP